MKCMFCNEIKEEQILLETASFKVIFDSDPIQLGHLLIISKSHADSIIDFTSETLLELIILEKKIVEALENNFNILGVSIIQNNGKVMEVMKVIEPQRFSGFLALRRLMAICILLQL